MTTKLELPTHFRSVGSATIGKNTPDLRFGALNCYGNPVVTYPDAGLVDSTPETKQRKYDSNIDTLAQVFGMSRDQVIEHLQKGDVFTYGQSVEENITPDQKTQVKLVIESVKNQH